MSSNSSAPTDPGKWPKIAPALTEEQMRISDDWMHHWHEINREKFSAVVAFGHRHVAERKGKAGELTLEIGAGLGEQLRYEPASRNARYIAMEYRWNMAQDLHRLVPEISCFQGDCQGYLPFREKSIDRVVAIHVLEHLPNLPECLRSIRRILKPTGKFMVVIPCEGGMAYAFARHFTSKRLFEKRYKTSYEWHIRSEHVNTAHEVLEELEGHFEAVDTSYYPFRVPLVHLNAVIALTLVPKKL